MVLRAPREAATRHTAALHPGGLRCTVTSTPPPERQRGGNLLAFNLGPCSHEGARGWRVAGLAHKYASKYASTVLCTGYCTCKLYLGVNCDIVKNCGLCPRMRTNANECVIVHGTHVIYSIMASLECRRNTSPWPWPPSCSCS